MNLLNKLTIKNLKLNKKRTIVTIIGIMLSVALITAVASIYASGIKSLIKFETREKGNFHTVFYDVPMTDIDVFENNRNIETLNITKSIGYAKIDSKNEYKPYAYIKAFTKDSLNNLSVKLVKGKLPENENEIVIPTHLQTNGRLFLNIGDSITLDIGKRIDNSNYELNQNNPYQKTDEENGESIVETISKTYKIVGIIERPATNVEGYSAPGYTFITYIDENKLTGNVDVYARFTKDGVKNSYETIANILGVDPVLFKKVNNHEGASNEDLKKYLNQMDKAKYSNINVNSYLIALETNPVSNTGIGGLGIVVGIVIGIIVFTSIFCIKNSFDISITEKIKQYGMLRSVGATKKQIKRNVFYEATILGIIGIPLGILLGFIASLILIVISNYYLADGFTEGLKLEFAFSWLAIIVAIILGIVTIYFSAFRSAKRASKVSPIDSIRNSANIKINPKKIKSPKLIKNIFGMGGEISFKNLKRNKKKYRTTVISIVVSVFVFIALSGFMGLAFQTVENELQLSDYNISLSADDPNNESYNKIIETTNLDNVENYTIYRNSELSFIGSHYSKEYMEFLGVKQNNNDENYISIISIGEEQYKKYIKSLGLNYNDIKDKAILVDSDYVINFDENDKTVTKYMRQFDFNKGDDIDVTITSTGKKTNLEIGAISEIIPFGLKGHNARYIIVSDKMFDELAKSRTVTIYYKSSDANKLQNDLDEYLKGESYRINNVDENAKNMNNLFTLIGIFLYGFIIVISLIGITNIFNTITTNMELRKQEFAMLKSVGMTTKEFNRMIRLESLFMGIKSLFFGIPIGVALSYVIHHFLSAESGIPYKLPIVAIIISIAVVFILISVIMKYSMNKINKQNTIETIRNENI
ncbi:MAG: ABC transporter permease [Bacilli bacterium]|nr:ABC transporter permease [Bacilli bacterium]MDY5058860.1 ABC transporter permease [Bacilli bacterium]